MCILCRDILNKLIPQYIVILYKLSNVKFKSQRLLMYTPYSRLESSTWQSRAVQVVQILVKDVHVPWVVYSYWSASLSPSLFNCLLRLMLCKPRTHSEISCHYLDLSWPPKSHIIRIHLFNFSRWLSRIMCQTTFEQQSHFSRIGISKPRRTMGQSARLVYPHWRDSVRFGLMDIAYILDCPHAFKDCIRVEKTFLVYIFYLLLHRVKTEGQFDFLRGSFLRGLNVYFLYF